MSEALANYWFFLSLNRASKCFWLTNLSITLLSCPLLFLESGNLWQPSISFGSISSPESLQILATLSTRSSSGMLFVYLIFPCCFCHYTAPLFWIIYLFFFSSLNLWFTFLTTTRPLSHLLFSATIWLMISVSFSVF